MGVRELTLCVWGGKSSEVGEEKTLPHTPHSHKYDFPQSSKIPQPKNTMTEGRGQLLLEAVCSHDIDTVTWLLDDGVSPISCDAVGQTALHKCAFMGFEGLARMLLRSEPSLVEMADHTHSTALHVAAFSGHMGVVSILIDAQASVIAVDHGGNTPLHRALLEGKLPVAQVLVAHGADVNALGQESSTPLHFVALGPSTDTQLALADLLLENGASPRLKNRHGTTPEGLARNLGRDALAHLLQDKSQPPPSPPLPEIPPSQPAAGPDERDVFLLVLEALQTPAILRLWKLFRLSHRHKFKLHEGGDYPLELSALHIQYSGLISRHIERVLSVHALTWNDVADACRRAVVDGRCSALRIEILRRLATVTDFTSFFNWMVSDATLEYSGESTVKQATGQSNTAADIYDSAMGDDLDANAARLTLEELAAHDDGGNHGNEEEDFPSPPPTVPASRIASEATVPSEYGDYGYGTCNSGVSSLPASLQSAEPPSTILEGSIQLAAHGPALRGRWPRGRRIGVGSSGEVFLVRDEVLMRNFAAKLVLPRDAEAASRLEKEIDLMRRVRHPHLVEYLGTAISPSGDTFIILEYCDGGSMRQLLEREHAAGLPSEVLRRYARQLLAGLAFLHEHLIIHRDLKGENILLHGSERATAKIGDCGSSRELLSGATLSGDVAVFGGSPYWMSPEHVQGSRCGRPADVWSFGGVILEMLTGRPPWTFQSVAAGATPAGEHVEPPPPPPHPPPPPPRLSNQFAVFELMNRIVNTRGPPPMPAVESMPDGVHEVLLACFERDVDQRPTTTALESFEWLRRP